MGFSKDANPDVTITLNRTIDLLNAMSGQPDLVIHTGDITHLSKPEEFDLARQLLSRLRITELHTVPGEHDITDGDGANYFERYGQASNNKGYYSFDHAGVHFIALVNVLNFKPGGLGVLGPRAALLGCRGPQVPLCQHPDRGLCSYAAVERV